MKYNPILFVSLLFTACTGNKERPQADADNALAVEVQTVTSQQFTNEISLSGNIEGKTTVKLSFLVPGKVEYISSKEGETITQGQVLSKLEPTNYTIAKQLADVQLNVAKDEFDRINLMYKNGSVSESDYAKTKFSLQQAELQQKLQNKNLADTKLYAPLTGVLLSKQAEVGEVIAAGTPLFVLADIKKVVVSAFIPEGELHQVTIGQPAAVSIAALNKTFTGKITDVGAIADATSRAFSIKIDIENPDLLIRPGMIAEVKINSKTETRNILVPSESIVHDTDNQNYIYIVDNNNNKAFKRKISLGKMIENQVQVIAGLSENEIIVTAGQSKLSDGVHISITK